jgi:DNA-binding transcriptional regulator YdaS (Cro superfamily)
MIYKTAAGVTLAFYAIILITSGKVLIEDLRAEIDVEYCAQYTSCTDKDCCIEATAGKEEHLKYD